MTAGAFRCRISQRGHSTLMKQLVRNGRRANKAESCFDHLFVFFTINEDEVSTRQTCDIRSLESQFL
jgi:hypothetical protein